MKENATHVKIVEWSDEDQCYVGSAPGMLYGGCHGSDETEKTASRYLPQLPGVTLPPKCRVSHNNGLQRPGLRVSADAER